MVRRLNVTHPTGPKIGHWRDEPGSIPGPPDVPEVEDGWTTACRPAGTQQRRRTISRIAAPHPAPRASRARRPTAEARVISGPDACTRLYEVVRGGLTSRRSAYE